MCATMNLTDNDVTNVCKFMSHDEPKQKNSRVKIVTTKQSRKGKSPVQKLKKFKTNSAITSISGYESCEGEEELIDLKHKNIRDKIFGTKHSRKVKPPVQKRKKFERNIATTSTNVHISSGSESSEDEEEFIDAKRKKSRAKIVH